MASVDITTQGYDPFASKYDAPERAIIGGLSDDDVGSLWGSIRSAAKGVVKTATAPVRATVKLSTGDFRGAWHVAKQSMRTGASVVTGTVGKYALSGAAIAFPPAAPALAGVYAGAKVLKQLDSPDPVKRAGAATTVAATQRMAAAGDPGATRGWAALSVAQKLMKGGATPASIRASAGLPSPVRTVRGVVIDSAGRRHGPALWRRQ